MLEGALRKRVEDVLARVDLVSLIAASIPLSRARNPRGKCPFHGSNSDSFAVYPDKGRATCWGCGWSGDAIKFVREMFGLGFIDALEQLESQNGLTGLEAKPVHREKRVQRRIGREPISSEEMGRILWREAVPDIDAVRTYLRARGVPESMLEAERLVQLKFHANAPIAAWVEGGRDRVATAPAMLACVRTLPALDEQAVHATYLSPDLRSKMERVDGRGEPVPPRKFLGSIAGGGVVFPSEHNEVPIDAAQPLYAAEGIETLLSGMAMLEAPATAVGIALLSLGNLQGGWRVIGKCNATPLYDIEPAQHLPVTFRHEGPVTGLIDADMKPLRGRNDRVTGQPVGVPVIERPGGPIVWRSLSSAERSRICGTLFVKRWRAAGCRRVRAVRPGMGHDFNDVLADRHGVSFREAVR